eukprot:g2326.t1
MTNLPLLILILILRVHYTSTSHISVNTTTNATTPFPHVWRATGWCPPGNKSSEAIARYALSESAWQNHAFIRASEGIDIVRIHDLLYLLDVASSGVVTPSNLNPSVHIDPRRLDAVLDSLVRDHGLSVGFELMGNPGSLFTSFRDPEQIASWKRLVAFVVSRYVDRYGIETVRRWRWEGWNEPDHVCNAARRMDAGIDCDLDSWLDYFTACAEGVRDTDASLRFGGPGTGGSTLSTPFLEATLASKRFAVDFVQWHKKGVLPTSTTPIDSTAYDREVCETIDAPMIVGNEEVDPEGDWSRSRSWRGDATYPAAIARTLAMHLHTIVDDPSVPVTWGYHANDNAFLNYGDRWFSQRTLTARFLMNATRTVEVIRKPALNLMRALSLLGTERLSSRSVVSNVVDVPGYGEDPTRYPVGIIATRRRSGATRWERCVLLYGSDAVLTHYAIDQENGNPMALWEAMGGSSNPYPSAEQFARLREASELVALSRRVLDPSATSVSSTFRFSRPSVHVFHICGGRVLPPNQTSLAIGTVTLRVTPTIRPPTVLVRWGAVSERCVSTYEVYWRRDRDDDAVRVNAIDTIHSIYVHAQPGSFASGCYTVRAVDYWEMRGPMSDEVCV